MGSVWHTRQQGWVAGLGEAVGICPLYQPCLGTQERRGRKLSSLPLGTFNRETLFCLERIDIGHQVADSLLHHGFVVFVQ
jgi:hypothetical protein